MTDAFDPAAERPTDRVPPDDLDDLLAAYALDALDDVEQRRVERLLEGVSPRSDTARRDLARYEDAIAGLVDLVDEVEPPAGTWEAIATAVASGPRAAGQRQPSGSAPPDIAHRARPLAARRRSRRLPLLAAAAVLVLGLTTGALLGAGLRGGDDGGGGGVLEQQFEAALVADGARRGALTGEAGQASIVVAADGTGYVQTTTLQELPKGRVYQLWSLDSGTPESLGVLTWDRDAIATFRAPAGSTTLALSVEGAPGAAAPTLPPVATVTLA